MKRTVKIKNIDDDVWKKFQGFIAVKHGGAYGKTGEEATKAFQFYMDSQARGSQHQIAQSSPSDTSGAPKLRRDVVERIEQIKAHIVKEKYFDPEDDRQWYRVGLKTLRKWVGEALQRDERTHERYVGWLVRLGVVRFDPEDRTFVHISRPWLFPMPKAANQQMR